MCSRRNSGKSANIAFSSMPPARYSSTSETVMRVPLTQGLPPRTPGGESYEYGKSNTGNIPNAFMVIRKRFDPRSALPGTPFLTHIALLEDRVQPGVHPFTVPWLTARVSYRLMAMPLGVNSRIPSLNIPLIVRLMGEWMIGVQLAQAELFSAFRGLPSAPRQVFGAEVSAR